MSEPIQAGTTGAKPAETKPEDPGVPMWIVLLLGLLVFWGLYYLNRHGGWFSSMVFEPFTTVAEVQAHNPVDPTQKMLATGQKVFEDSCIKCHQADGLGKADQFPPLDGSDWLNADGVNRIGRIVLVGLSGSIRVQYSGGTFVLNAAMPTQGIYTDEQLAAVLSYVRQKWSNKSQNHPFVTPDQITKIRAAIKDHPGPFKPDELLAIPVK
jgi:mono/diheme cytochrome c family protein